MSPPAAANRVQKSPHVPPAAANRVQKSAYVPPMSPQPPLTVYKSQRMSPHVPPSRR